MPLVENVTRLEAIGMLSGIELPMVTYHKSSADELDKEITRFKRLNNSYLESELSGDKRYKIVNTLNNKTSLTNSGIINLSEVMAKYKCKYPQDRLETQIRYGKYLQNVESQIANGLYKHFIGYNKTKRPEPVKPRC